MPEHHLARWWLVDGQIAAETYGNSAVAQPHEFPCLGHGVQARKGTSCLVLILGVARNKQANLVLDGPNGSDLPNGKLGEAMSIGHVYTALSSASTRIVGNSNANGWMIRVHNCIEMEVRMIRPVENGPGVAGTSRRRLRWLVDLRDDIMSTAKANDENIALSNLASTLERAAEADVDTTRPPEFDDKEYAGLLIWRGLQQLAVPNKDKDVRQRTKSFPRQLKRTQRKRESRLPVGTSMSKKVKIISYANAVKCDSATGDISVLALADSGRRLKVWVPWSTVCAEYRELLLTSCMRDVLAIITSDRHE